MEGISFYKLKEGINVVNVKEKYPELVSYKGDLYKRLIPTLTTIFNSVHNTAEDEVFWDFVLYRFSTVYLREVVGHMAISPFLDSTTLHRINQKRYSLASAIGTEDKDFYTTLKNEPLLTEEVMRVLYVESLHTFETEILDEVESFAKSTKQVTGFKKLRRRLSVIFNRIGGQSITFNNSRIFVSVGVFNQHQLNQLASKVSSLQEVNPHYFDPVVKFSHETKRFLLIKEAQKFRDQLQEKEYRLLLSLLLLLPMQYVEFFSSYNKRALKLVSNRPRPKAFLADSLPTLGSRIYALLAQKHGSKLVLMQHGGYYGESPVALWESTEIRSANIFVTWGWRTNEKTFPMPSPKLAGSVQGNRTDARDKILWVTRESLTRPSVTFFDLIDYEKVQEEFYTNLDPAIQKDILLRLFIKATTEADTQSLWRFKYPTLQVDMSGKKIKELFVSTRLILTDYYFSTVFMEGIAIGIPTICFQGRDSKLLLNESARVIYDYLIEANVVFTDHRALVIFLNQNYETIESWWESPKTRWALDMYKTTFCHHKDFESNWVHFLSTL